MIAYVVRMLFCFLFASLSSTINAKPDVYVFLGGGPLANFNHYWQHPLIKGAQIIYPWKRLEPQKNVYDFRLIKDDLEKLSRFHKKLYIQIQDKSFSPDVINVPDYLLSDEYEGGVAKQTDFPRDDDPHGWVAKQWVPAVNKRFQKLIMQLGKSLDGKIEGINLTETAIDLEPDLAPQSFTCDRYFKSVIHDMRALHKAFNNSKVTQYVNYFPCEWDNDHHYMSRLFRYAIKHDIGLGNPDTVPYRKGQMQNSYPYFHRFKNQLVNINIAVQEPDYTYIDDTTGKPFTIEKIYYFAQNYLGVTTLFWNVQEPEFTEKLIPFLENRRLLGDS